MSSTDTESGNRAARAIVLVGFLQATLWVAVGVSIVLDSTFGSSASTAGMIGLLWWHAPNALVALYTLTLVCLPSLLVPRALIVGALLALAASVVGASLAFTDLVRVFPSFSLFVYLFFIYHATFVALALAFVFFDVRLLVAGARADDVAAAAAVPLRRAAATVASKFVPPNAALRQRSAVSRA